MKERKEELERQMRKLRTELNEIQDRENAERFSGLVGKCFVYRNCYSCPEKPSDYWDSYCQVHSITGSYANVMEFEIDKDGMIRIHPDRCVPANMLGTSWKPLTVAQFKRQIDRCLKASARILQA